MYKVIICVFMLFVTTLSYAKTTIYGEANARIQLVSSEEGSALYTDGSLSSFGFQGEQVVTEQHLAYFDMSLGIDALGGTPYLNEGVVGLKGGYGEISAFYGYSPVASTSNYFKLMDNDPDSIWLLNGYNSSNYTPKGVRKVDGVSYRSVTGDEPLIIQAALVPAETIEGVTGLSFSGRLNQGSTDISLGYEVNVEQAHSQLFRVVGEYELSRITLGGQVQVSSNSENNYASHGVAGFLKFSASFVQLNTNNRIMLGYNTEIDPSDNTTRQIYTSFLQAIPLSDKVSSYSFIGVLLDNDLESTTTSGGAGLKVSF